MVNFIVTPKTLVIGDRLSYEINQMDSSKGHYIIVIKDYNSSMDEFTLYQQQNVFDTRYGQKGLSGRSSNKIVNSSDFTTLTVFYFDSYNSTDFSSVEEFEQSVTLGEYTAKSETFNISIYDGKRKSGIVTWLRQWFNTKEEHDAMLFTDSGWQTCSLSSGYSVYSSGTNLRVKKIGKLVEVTGMFKNNSASSTSSATGVQFATIPTGYRPTRRQIKICQGSSMNRWLLTIESNGKMYWSRYGTNSYASASSGSWFPYTITYMVE